MQLASSVKADGKPACFYWRSVPISGAAVSRLQPSLPPLKEGSLPPIPNADYATAIWAMEGYLQAMHLGAHTSPLCTAFCMMPYLRAATLHCHDINSRCCGQIMCHLVVVTLYCIRAIMATITCIVSMTHSVSLSQHNMMICHRYMPLIHWTCW